MSVKLHIPRLRANARQRADGYADFVLARGKINGDFVELDEEALLDLYEKFPNPLTPHPAREKRFHIPNLRATAGRRPVGYVDFILAHGRIEGDFAQLDDEALNELRQKFPPTAPKPRLPEPAVAEMAVNFTSAMAAWVKAGFPVVEHEVYEQRHAICLACEYWDAHARAGLGKCNRCGCSRAKLWLAPSECPLQPPKW